MNTSHIFYTPHRDSTLEAEVQILAAVYRFILDCHAKKKAGVPSTGNDGKEIKDVPANSILPQRR